MPSINYQDTQLSLFEENVIGNSYGFNPDSEGISFGGKISIDKNGFRKMKGPDEFKSSWLILGDSVTFGVGVDVKDTFIGKLQEQYPDVKIWNTAVMGYSVKNYYEVFEYFITKKGTPQKIILFFPLNDIYGNIKFKPQNYNLKDKIRLFLKQNSKLYMFLKGAFFDRSRTYFLNDLRYYKPSNPQLKESLKLVTVMKNIAEIKGSVFVVFIIPYEYQLRMFDPEFLIPQQLLIEYFKDNDINYVNVIDDLKRTKTSPKKLYLYADAMHLSKRGHERLFESIKSYLSYQ
jgi:lysophospholipase L1-like esterase